MNSSDSPEKKGIWNHSWIDSLFVGYVCAFLAAAAAWLVTK